MNKRLPLLAALTLLPGLLVSCAPVPAQGPPNQAPVELARPTPTPEVFNPLNPSPTPSDSELPLSCQVTDLNVYLDYPNGFCFAYPLDFTLADGPTGKPDVLGPALDEGLQPLRAVLQVDAYPVPAGSDLGALVNAYLATYQDIPWAIARASLVLGGEPAEKLEPVPGQGSARVLLTLHRGRLIALTFRPLDFEAAAGDLAALYQTVSGSFAFLPSTNEETGSLSATSLDAFGRTFSLSYDARLAPWVLSRTVAAVPVSDMILFAESRPEFAQFRFYGFQGGRSYDLPLLPFDNRVAQVMIFPIDGFPGFGDDSEIGFTNQMETLKGLLAGGFDPARCEIPYDDVEVPLPFLPWLNARQTFCAQAQILQFDGGRGLRYITQYSQSMEPVLDKQVFYTFQGLSDDGRFYVSAAFPVETGIFPTEPTACPECGQPDYNPFEEWANLLADQVSRLNALSEDAFNPALAVLDQVVTSLSIGP